MADDKNEEASSFIGSLISEIIYSPLNLGLLAVCFFLLYKMFFNKKEEFNPVSRPPDLPPLKKKDMTYEELKKYDGTNAEGRVCVAVNGKVFDVTRGKHFYGPGGPYASFAGKDATRGLATFSVEATSEYDDISDLTSMQMDSVREWEIQFQEKYIYVGKLLKPGEDPTDYSEDEDNSQDHSSQGNPEQKTKKDE